MTTRVKAGGASRRATLDEAGLAILRERAQAAVAELSAAEEATRIGSSQTFLGASVMLVGLSEYPIGEPHSGGGRDVVLNIDSNMHYIRLHGDPEVLKNMRGRYKAIVLLFKAD